MGTRRTQEVAYSTKETFSPQNIAECEEYVFSMQQRLDRAVANNNFVGIRNTFDILIRRSHAVKVLAVWRITSQNAGRNTAGVDNVCIPKGAGRKKTDRIRHKMLNSINTRRKSDPIRRTYIPKANVKKRPLGIPTLRDRINQEIYRIALDPIVEYHSHDNSFGFRPKRSCHDAEDTLHRYLSQANRKRYIIEGDIKGCFDHINHQHIIATLRKWQIPEYALTTLMTMLKSDIIHNADRTASIEGTPQGGVISPMLANVALTTFDNYCAEKYGVIQYHGGKHRVSPMIRYADDFVILCKSKQVAKQIKKEISTFLLEEIGLTLSKEKTKITHIRDGFNFLGFSFRKYKKNKTSVRDDLKLLVRPEKEKVINFLQNCKETIDRHKASTQEGLIRSLNPLIRGWGNYYRHVNSKMIFGKVDYAIYKKLQRWSERRHNNKGKRWVIDRYFVSVSGKRYKRFEFEDIALQSLSELKVTPKRKVKRGKRVYNKEDVGYWKEREEELAIGSIMNGKRLSLHKKQRGKCPVCSEIISHDDVINSNVDLHHRKPLSKGGNESYSNLQLLHKECHRYIHSRQKKGIGESNG